MKRTARSGRRTWVYVAGTAACAVWGKQRPFGRWDPWALERGLRAFDVNCYRRLSTDGERYDRDGRPLLETDRAKQVAGLVDGDVVYAFYSKAGHVVKIGRTTNIQRRWMKLEHESGQLRQLLSSWRSPDSRELEHQLHQRWLPHRTFGEWFSADPVLADLTTQFRQV